jgi:hypothetical protein
MAVVAMLLCPNCRPKPELADQIHPKTGKSYAGTQHKHSTINHRLSVLTSFFAHCIHRDDLRGEGAWRNRVNPVAPSARQDAITVWPRARPAQTAKTERVSAT